MPGPEPLLAVLTDSVTVPSPPWGAADCGGRRRPVLRFHWGLALQDPRTQDGKDVEEAARGRHQAQARAGQRWGGGALRPPTRELHKHLTSALKLARPAVRAAPGPVCPPSHAPLTAARFLFLLRRPANTRRSGFSQCGVNFSLGIPRGGQLQAGPPPRPLPSLLPPPGSLPLQAQGLAAQLRDPGI